MSSAVLDSRTGARKFTEGLVTATLVFASVVLALTPSLASASSFADSQNLDLIGSVSGERMVSTVTDLQNFGARTFFLTSMWNASIYVYDRFAELGLWVKYQDFQVDGFPQRNVVAVLNGTDPAAPRYLFGAHYDSITEALLEYKEGDPAFAPGADDDASGVAAVIELATVLHDRKFNSTIKFVAFGAEETGLNGSNVFVQEELASGTLYSDTVIMDMIGYRASEQNKAVIFRDKSSNTMSESIRDAINSNGLNLSLTFVSGTSASYSDHYPFWLAGYPSILIIEELVDGLPANPYYHTEHDTVSLLSSDLMTVVTKAVLGGFLELQNPHEERNGNAVVLVSTAVMAATIVIVISLYIINRRKVVE